MAIKIMAERQAPGDRWLLTEEATNDVDNQVMLTSLTSALNEIYKNTGDRIYTIDAHKGIISVETEVNRGPQIWDLYGEREDKQLLND
jgi:hypothetical protein